MADINQTITLGIGTPAGVPEFLTLGLQISQAVVPDTPGLEYKAEGERLHYKDDGERLFYQAVEP